MLRIYYTRKTVLFQVKSRPLRQVGAAGIRWRIRPVLVRVAAASWRLPLPPGVQQQRFGFLLVGCRRLSMGRCHRIPAAAAKSTCVRPHFAGGRVAGSPLWASIRFRCQPGVATEFRRHLLPCRRMTGSAARVAQWAVSTTVAYRFLRISRALGSPKYRSRPAQCAFGSRPSTSDKTSGYGWTAGSARASPRS